MNNGSQSKVIELDAKKVWSTLCLSFLFLGFFLFFFGAVMEGKEYQVCGIVKEKFIEGRWSGKQSGGHPYDTYHLLIYNKEYDNYGDVSVASSTYFTTEKEQTVCFDLDTRHEIFQGTDNYNVGYFYFYLALYCMPLVILFLVLRVRLPE